jgi:two-component system, cell cycle response regulator DivK
MARILVVEDNPQNLKLATVILKTAGHTVVGARDAEEFERALAKEIPDLILMDLALPGKDGYTLAGEIRRRPEMARLPVLAVSSFAMRGDAERALAAGCTAYLTKPIRRDSLLKLVSSLLGDPPETAQSPTVDAPAEVPKPVVPPPTAAPDAPPPETPPPDGAGEPATAAGSTPENPL